MFDLEKAHSVLEQARLSVDTRADYVRMARRRRAPVVRGSQADNGVGI